MMRPMTPAPRRARAPTVPVTAAETTRTAKVAKRVRRRQDGRMTLVEAATRPAVGRLMPWIGAWMR